MSGGYDAEDDDDDDDDVAVCRDNCYDVDGCDDGADGGGDGGRGDYEDGDGIYGDDMG